jgi:hypothetical protein
MMSERTEQPRVRDTPQTHPKTSEKTQLSWVLPGNDARAAGR